MTFADFPAQRPEASGQRTTCSHRANTAVPVPSRRDVLGPVGQQADLFHGTV